MFEELCYLQTKYTHGIHLRAGPDPRVLGKPLKGDLKAVTCPSSSEGQGAGALPGEGDHCCGRHELHKEDIRLMYTSDQTAGGTIQFDAHWDAQALILFDG